MPKNSNRIPPPVRWERIPRRTRYDTSLKSDSRRNGFLAFLERCGWDHLGQDHLGADLFQLGDARLAVDGQGLFVYDRANGHWVRRAGL
jgi:hypothetical protein